MEGYTYYVITQLNPRRGRPGQPRELAVDCFCEKHKDDALKLFRKIDGPDVIMESRTRIAGGGEIPCVICDDGPIT